MSAMYLSNKYTTWYKNIISNANSRILDEDIYTETHHIFPKSIWPEYKDEEWNKIKLTAREHFICHLLLPHMLPKGDIQNKMKYALKRISFSPYGDRKLSSRTFEYIKSLSIPHSEETKKKISKANTGKNNSNYGKKAWSNGLTKETSTLIKQIAEKNKGKPAWNKGKKHTAESKLKMSAKQKGRIFSEEHKRKLSESKKGSKNPNYGKVPWNKKSLVA